MVNSLRLAKRGDYTSLGRKEQVENLLLKVIRGPSVSVPSLYNFRLTMRVLYMGDYRFNTTLEKERVKNEFGNVELSFARTQQEGLKDIFAAARDREDFTVVLLDIRLQDTLLSHLTNRFPKLRIHHIDNLLQNTDGRHQIPAWRGAARRSRIADALWALAEPVIPLRRPVRAAGFEHT